MLWLATPLCPIPPSHPLTHSLSLSLTLHHFVTILQAVCSSCMLADKQLTGTSMSLCPLCYEEREVRKCANSTLVTRVHVLSVCPSV